MSGTSSVPELATLIGTFFAAPEDLGQFQEIPADQMPPNAHRLLVHEHHMTVTVEAYHGCLVDLDVLQTRILGSHYAREILLRRRRDHAVVQYGIAALDLSVFPRDLAEAVRRCQEPLGRLLIRHDILRQVRPAAYYRIATGPRLRRLFALEASARTYGRTAMIFCQGEPAVQLLEIVAPVGRARH